MSIVGGGVIGLEFAHLFASFGVNVTVIEAMKGILPGFDVQISKRLGVLLKKQGVKILTNTMIKSANILEDGVELILGEDKKIKTDKVLVAVGRKPNLSGIETDKLKIENGFIATDNNFLTTENDIYAIGDVSSRLMLAHYASAQAEHLIKKLSCKTVGDFYKKPVPACVFSSRDFATVGKTEEELKSIKMEYKVGNFSYQACSMAVAMNETDGLIKILSDNDGNILGAHILGEGASELIHEIALGMETGLKIQEISELIHAHPTLSEIVKEASGDVFSNAVHKYYRI
jgi:dihydrolipoamide dehydrogenase